MGPYSDHINSYLTHNLGDLHSKAQTHHFKVEGRLLETGRVILTRNGFIHKKEGGISPYTTLEKSLAYVKCKRQGRENVEYATNYLQKEDL